MAVIDMDAIDSAIGSSLQKLGVLDSVMNHESMNSAGNKRYEAEYWFGSMIPIPTRSGLASTSYRLNYMIRVRTPLNKDFRDNFDKKMIAIVAAIFTEWEQNFDFDIDAISQIDILGAYGDPMAAVSGFYDVQGVDHRIVSINLPLILKGEWEQAQ